MGGSTNVIEQAPQVQVPQLPADPNLADEQARAHADLIGALQMQTQGDMASLMARYGTHLAMAGSGGVSGAGAISPMQAPSRG